VGTTRCAAVSDAPVPRMLTVDAARYCGFRSARGLLSAFRRGKLYPVGRRGTTGSFTWRREDLDAFLRGEERWVHRWRYMMASTPRRGIWRLKDGGYFVRVRVTDSRTGRRYQCARALRGANVTIWDAVRVRDQLRHEGHDRVEGKILSMPLWSEYAASLFEAKVAEGKLSSSKSRERWATSSNGLIPVFDRPRVDELRTADLVAWREEL
jgi:hypothetical protein